MYITQPQPHEVYSQRTERADVCAGTIAIKTLRDGDELGHPRRSVLAELMSTPPNHGLLSGAKVEPFDLLLCGLRPEGFVTQKSQR